MTDGTKDLIRQSLREHAGDARSDVDFAVAARSRASRRRRARVSLVIGASLAAVLVALIAVAVRRDEARPAANAVQLTGGQPTNERPFKGIDIQNWRYESYHGVQVRVPPSWAWGGTPPSRYKECGPFFDQGYQEFRGAIFNVGYVGRPDAAAWWQLCANPMVDPHTPYVWFNSPERVGNDRAAFNSKLSILRTTLEVNGVRITVADNNTGEREAILGTIESVGTDGNGCPVTFPASISGKPWFGHIDTSANAPLSSIGMAQRASVCVYDGGDGTEKATIVASVLLPARLSQRAQTAIDATPGLRHRADPICSSTVIINFHGDRRDARAAVQPCPGYVVTDDRIVAMTRANTAPWLVGPVRSYLIGNGGLGVLRQFTR